MIEVFRTNIEGTEQAAALHSAISNVYPHYRINFDLEDCDRILRIISHSVDHNAVIELAGSVGVNVEVLPG